MELGGVCLDLWGCTPHPTGFLSPLERPFFSEPSFRSEPSLTSQPSPPPLQAGPWSWAASALTCGGTSAWTS